MEHHNVQWEDIFWLKWKVREKEVKPDFAEFLSLLQLKLQELTVDGFADNVGAKCKLGYFIYPHTFISEDYKPNNIWLQHFSSNFFQSHDPSLSVTPHPKLCYICVSTSSFLHIHPEDTYCNAIMFRHSAYEVGKTWKPNLHVTHWLWKTVDKHM